MSETTSNEQGNTSLPPGINGSLLTNSQLGLQAIAWALFYSKEVHFVGSALYENTLGDITPGMLRKACADLRKLQSAEPIALAAELEKRFAHLLVEVV